MDELTYEQRVQQMAERYQKDYYRESRFPTIREQQKSHSHCIRRAKIAIAAQAEAIREFDKSLPNWVSNIENYLIENGYIPSPKNVHSIRDNNL
jgi:hypothetical protein